MDRDKNNDRVDKSYRVLTLREGNTYVDHSAYLKAQYKEMEAMGKDGSDEFIIPAYSYMSIFFCLGNS